ncbi:hypothetical protein FHS85_001364 [Rhodoligotrophos appendicifer]|uniref:putative signal transducing protein n=1 Tax=Rhodoligotrophos appendicifer TaxID=987056 RepID=UPI001185D210|nr:DUF2007 domain-containing protein [Rhodoligotrophos appendicifer]
MREVLRSNDLVVISFASSLLTNADIEHVVFDSNMSSVEGSLGVLPRRLMVSDDRFDEAKSWLSMAGIE